MHKNPIPSVHHLPGNLGVTGLIWIPEIPSAQIDKIKDKTDSDKENNLSPFGRIIYGKRVSHEMEILSLFKKITA
jgi:hypothetical protein